MWSLNVEARGTLSDKYGYTPKCKTDIFRICMQLLIQNFEIIILCLQICKFLCRISSYIRQSNFRANHQFEIDRSSKCAHQF